MRPPLRRLLAILFIGIIVAGVWIGVDAIRTADHGERALHACLQATHLLEQYVESTNGRWPGSWEDLEQAVPSARGGGVFRWPEDRRRMERYVQIDFSAEPALLARRPAEDLHAIMPVGTCYSTYGRHFPLLLETLRRHHPGD